MSNRMYENCGYCGKRYGLHIDISCPDNFNSVFEPTGKYEGENMSDKIQMTEEQFITMMNDIGWTEINAAHYILNVAKKSGYIIKPEIEQKIEEVEGKRQRSA